MTGPWARRVVVRLLIMLPATLPEVKRKILITEISVLYARRAYPHPKESISRPSRISWCIAFMKIAGFLLLLAGWLLVLAAVVLLHPGTARGAFTVAGMGVQILGLALVFRSHRIPHGRHP